MNSTQLEGQRRHQIPHLFKSKCDAMETMIRLDPISMHARAEALTALEKVAIKTETLVFLITTLLMRFEPNHYGIT